jgi:hypothetical protein
VWSGASARAAGVLYVSPEGKDGAAGTRVAPLRTLAGARDAVRALKAAGLPQGGVVVTLLPGQYSMPAALELVAEDGGTAEAPITYRAAKRGTVSISGGVVLSGWTTVTDPAIQKLIAPEAKGHVVCVTLGSDLLETIPGFANGGCGYRGKPEYPIGLYQDGSRLPISRWPNEGYTKMGECLGHNEIHGHTGIAYTEGWFRFEDKRLARWVGEPDLWFDGLWFHHWADQKMALEKLDPVAKTIRLRNGKSHAFGFKKGQEFYAFNAIGEIDRPGEWAVDRTGRTLYLWPAQDLHDNPVVVATRPSLLLAKDVQHVRFEDLTFENCTQTAIRVQNGQSVTISGSTFRHTGSWAVEIAGGNDCTVIGCDLYDLGEGGIKASGGDQSTLTPGNHLIENNHIHHFGRIVNTYRPGAAVYGVGNTIRHNLIHHAQHQAVFFNGNDHLIEYNVVHDICLHTSDAGALYACARDWSQRGVVIRQNFIHATAEGVDGCGSHGIYLDDYTSGATVVGNIVSSVGHAVVTCGNGNLIENNIAINARKASFNFSSRGVNTFARVNAQKGMQSPLVTKLLDPKRPYTSDAWKSRYPHLGQLLDRIQADPIDAHESHFGMVRNNVNVGGVPSSVANAAKVEATGTLDPSLDIYEDPGFVDYEGFDLRLRPDAAIRKKLPGFTPPEFEKMGLYADSRRASPAVKFGSEITPMPPILTLEERERAKLSIPLSVPPVPDAIAVDGQLKNGEWPSMAAKPLPQVKWRSDGQESPLASQVRLAADQANLLIAIASEISPARRATAGHVWGEDDGVEIALAVATSPTMSNRVDAVVFHGYADGHAESVTAGGLNEADAARALQGVRYAAAQDATGRWTAEWSIPFASFGFDPKGTNYPILAHITVRRPIEDTWVGWRQRRSPTTWDVKGAYALCLESLGTVAFIPGQELPVARVDIQGRRDNTELSMQPGAGAEAPPWAQKWNRLVGGAGTLHADKWQQFRLEFTPQEDTTVTVNLMGLQTKDPAPLAWTYYDDFQIEGAELVNGDFETVGEDGKIPGWNCVLDRNFETVSRGKAGVVDLGAEAASGSKVGCATHDHRLTQDIRITKGRKVTITYKAKGVLPNLP